jgi:hypothetical protein
MLHFTCDLCGRELLPGTTTRYVVKVEIFAAHDPADLAEDDLDEDHMEEVSQLLHEVEQEGISDTLPPTSQHMRYDLCPACHKRFSQDPLGRKAVMQKKLNFSEN